MPAYPSLHLSLRGVDLSTTVPKPNHSHRLIRLEQIDTQDTYIKLILYNNMYIILHLTSYLATIHVGTQTDKPMRSGLGEIP